jgi:hypothetical protein
MGINASKEMDSERRFFRDRKKSLEDILPISYPLIEPSWRSKR